MSKPQNFPDVVSLDDESVLYLSIANSWLNSFPSALRQFTRFKADRLHLSIVSREISPYGLLCAAYVGVAPLPCAYGHFMTQTERVNKAEPHSDSSAFRKNRIARENSAASEFGMSRQEFKRLLKHLDVFAEKFAAVSTFAAVFNCKDEILQDQSPHSPADRETYANGPLYLWDIAKAVTEHNLVDMAFDTLDGWVLFVHREKNMVVGQAIHPLAHRFGNFSTNTHIDVETLYFGFGPVIEVPSEVQVALVEFADRRFPGHAFEFVPPPIAHLGNVYRSKPTRLALHSAGTEG